MQTILSDSIISIGLVFMLFGVIGIFRFRNFYAKLLITAKIETVGFITVLIGVMVHAGPTFFSLKVLIILLFAMFTNPLSTHAIGRSALLSGVKRGEERDD